MKHLALYVTLLASVSISTSALAGSPTASNDCAVVRPAITSETLTLQSAMVIPLPDLSKCAPLAPEAGTIAAERAQSHAAMLEKFSREIANGKMERHIHPRDIGIRDFAEVAGLIGSFNEWFGYVDGKPYMIVAGYEFADPLHGDLIILEGNEKGRIFYTTPVAAGPIYIKSESSGVLKLISRAGHFRFYDENEGRHKSIDVQGGNVFEFDIRSRRFR